VGYVLAVAAVDEVHLRACQDIAAEVAAAFDPVVVLLGGDLVDEADQGVAVGEEPDDVGASADLSVQPASHPVLG
jgi:hypothetical protein